MGEYRSKNPSLLCVLSLHAAKITARHQ